MKTLGLLVLLLLPACALPQETIMDVPANRPATRDCLVNPPTDGFLATICRDLVKAVADEQAARLARVLDRRAIFTPSPWRMQEPQSFDTRIYTNLGNGFVMGPDGLYVFY